MPTKKTDPRDRPETLLAFSEPLQQTAIELHTVKATLAILQKRRDAIYAQIKTSYARGARGDHTWVLRRTDGWTKTARTVPAEVIKKADRKLWEQSRALAPHVLVVAPEGTAVAPSGLRMPPIPTTYEAATTLMRAYKDPVFERIKELSDREQQLKAVVGRIASRTPDWDGSELRFSDGWAVGARRLKYDPDRLRRIAPEVFEALAEDRETHYEGRIDVIEYSLAVSKGYIEAGDIEFAE